MKHKKVFQFHSIRHRIMLIFVGLMAAMLFAIWGVNSWWLERYYVDQKLKVMEEAYTDIDTVIQEKVGENENIGDVLKSELEQEWEIWKQTAKGEEDSDNADASGETSGTDTLEESSNQADEVPAEDLPTDLPQEQGTLLGTIRSYSEQNNIAMTLIDSDTGKALITSGRDSDFLTQKLQRYVLGKGQKHMQVLKQHDNYVVEKNMDFRSSGTYMESWGYFSDNRTMFIMSMPLASIRESVELSNRFTTWVGLIALVFGSALMCFVTNRITKPILKLSSLSEEMSKLNFDVAYEDDAEDEVGILGRSMNSLSHSLKDAIGALQAANKQLQHDIDEKIQIDEMRKEFIANVSHELKTPMTSMKVLADSLLEQENLPVEMYREFMEDIAKEIDRENQIITDLLSLVKMNRTGQTMNIQQVNINDLLEQILKRLKPIAEKKNVEMVMESFRPVSAEIDETKFTLAVSNLVENAIKYNHENGWVHVSLNADHKYFYLKVEDSGLGIPQEDQAHIFERFYRVDKSHSREIGGTGLGLAIARNAVIVHRGSIKVHSNEGEGTTFTVRIPLIYTTVPEGVGR